MIHDLKIVPIYFKAVEEGKKKFEIRKNDRDFHVGDTVILHEWSSVKGYTGYQIIKKIGFLTNYEQKPGYVVFGLE